MSCKDSVGKDGYYFEEPTQRIASRPIRVLVYPTQNALVAEYRLHPNGRSVGNNESLQAFSVIDSQVCTIHMMDPKQSYQPEYFGHELTHCLYGNFHPVQDAERKTN
jgi:hypothetical protein